MMGVIHKCCVPTDCFVSFNFKAGSVPLHHMVHGDRLQCEEDDGDDQVEGQCHVGDIELAQEVVESTGDKNTGDGTKGDGNPHVSHIVVFSIEEGEEDGDDCSRENPVEGTHSITDEPPGVKADEQLSGSG